MNATGTKSQRRKTLVHTNVKQCAYCNANYHSERNTSKYCCSTCRTKAWQERRNEETRIPEIKLPESFYQEFYSKLQELLKDNVQEKKEDERAYLYEIECGYETPQNIVQELTERIRYSLSFDDYRKIYYRKYGDSKPKDYQINYRDVVVYLQAYES